MILATSGTEIVLLVVLVVIAILVLSTLYRSVRLIQQGTVGVQKRLGQYHSVRNPGLTFLVPFVDQIQTVDVREIPRTGDQQDVITKDNVSVLVSATIFSQVVDPKAALFAVSSYDVAIFQLARTALRAVFGGLTLDEALTERERINAELQGHMEPVTDKWGVRINRIEIVDIVPPTNVLQAMSLQKEAEQQKRALILKAEGERQAAINEAEGKKQSAILAAEGQKQAQVRQAEGEREAVRLRAEGRKAALIQEAEGRAEAVRQVYTAILSSNPTPELLAVLQLDTLSRLVESDNAKIVVPYESAGLMGASQMLKSVLDAAGSAAAGAGGPGSTTPGPSGAPGPGGTKR
ncbi:MAG: SPFH/Band 7/PHB domain protein [Actinomycetota bacterium]|jgi:regulator of protease activity HflC (stomatin/prohibitin superfamily)|nr:SPFH/Band 7/PHB domain protein [Actinomycetota bacterium]